MFKIEKMNLKKDIIVLFSLIFIIASCKAIDRKIDNLSLEEEKNLSRFLGKQQIELIDEFGKPDGVIHNDDGKILIFLQVHQPCHLRKFFHRALLQKF